MNDQEIIKRLDRIEAMLTKIAGISDPTPPVGVSPTAARLISLARVDRSAAIAEAKRLARESSPRRRGVKS